MNELIALALKDARLLVRDRAGFFFTFLWPVIMAIFFGSIFSGGGSDSTQLSVLVVDEDQTPESASFLAEVEESPELLTELVANRGEAITRVRRGQAVAALVLTEGFGSASSNLFNGATPTVAVAVDPARRAESGLLSGLLLKLGASRVQSTFSDTANLKEQIAASRRTLAVGNVPGMESLQTFLGSLDKLLQENPEAFGSGGAGASPFEPLSVETLDIEREPVKGRPTNAFAISFPQGMIWGILGCTAAFGISLVTERVRGTLTRLRTAPLSAWQILGGKALACFGTAQLLAATILLLGIVVFDVRPQSYPLLALAMVCSGLCFVGIMMMLSVLGKTEQAASGVGWAALLLMSMIGGGMIPLFVMPSWMRMLSHFSPVKWAILSFEGAIWRGFTLTEMLIPCGILLGVGLLTFVLGLRAFRFNST